MPLAANHIGKLLDVLGAAAQEQDWPTRMQLPDAVDELSLWTEDERQWGRAWPRNWKSLMEDVIASAVAFGPATQAAADVPDLLRELKTCRSLLSNEETRVDPALRQRVRGVVETTRERFQRNETLVAAWADVTARVESQDAAETAARQLLALGTWRGHGRKALSQALQAELRKPPTAEQAIAAASDFLRRPPRRAHMVVWLRYLLAPMKDSSLALGDAVRLYSEAWLNECLEHAPDHPGAPPEARDDEHESLKMFCQTRGDEEDDPERPVTYVRIDLGDELVARAVTVARDTAEAIASLGIIYGADPSIWRLDDGNLLYADGEAIGTSASPPVVEQPTFDQRMGVRRDRTIAGLTDVADKFGPLLPVRDPGVHAAATLLGWLREARRAGGPLQLVLFDRVIESASGWAGINSMSRFIQDELIPWWAYNRIRNEIQVAGLEAVWAGGGPYPAGSPERKAQREILQHPPLEASIGGEGTSINLQGVLTETAWLLMRVPADSTAHRRLSELARRTRTGKSTADWWTELTKQANRLEARRLRTRNALIHGGPLAAATIDGVARFGEHIASEALAACVEGRLLERDLIDYFLHRNRRLANVRADLQTGADPAHALFWED